MGKRVRSIVCDRTPLTPTPPLTAVTLQSMHVSWSMDFHLATWHVPREQRLLTTDLTTDTDRPRLKGS